MTHPQLLGFSGEEGAALENYDRDHKTLEEPIP
jgi:hypothetical protein